MIIPTFMVKLLELTFATVCMVLHQYSYDLTDLSTLMLCSGTYVGFVVILSGEIIGEVISAGADAYVEAWWCACGSALFGLCGTVTLRAWQDVPRCERRHYAQLAAASALANAVLMGLDALMSLCSATKDDLSSVKSVKVKSRKCTSCT